MLLNPAPAPTRPLDSKVLNSVDLLTPNESEAFSLTGISVSTPEGAIKAAKCLSEIGVKQAVITLGGKGCVYGNGAGFYHMPAISLGNIVDSTAAGDSFSAALAVALIEGRTLGQAVSFATQVSALTVMRKGAQPSLPYRSEVEEI